MPPITLGPCLWYVEPGAPPNAAMVTYVGRDAISVTVFDEGHRGGAIRQAVRHVSDPTVLKTANHESGLWDYTESEKALQELRAAVKLIQKK